MLFTIGLLLLLTPFQSLQTTSTVKRDSTGSDVTKASGLTKAIGVLTLSKPKPTAAPTKQTVRPALKPNTVNQTVLPTPASNQKPSAVNATVTTKSKLWSAVIQTTPSPAVKATTSSGTVSNKDKPTASANQTVATKTLSKDKPASSTVHTVLSTSAKAVKEDKDKVTVSSNQTTANKAQSSSSKTVKDKLQPLVNQTVSVKSPSGSEVRSSKVKPVPRGTPDVQSTPTKSASASGAKTLTDKRHPSANQTVSVKSHSASEVKTSKDKTAPAGASDGQSTPTKSVSASGAKTTKEKLQPLVNQTVSVKLPSSSEVRPNKDIPATAGAPDVQPTSTKSVSASGAKTLTDKRHPSANLTVSVKSPSGSEVRPNKDIPATAGAPDVQSSSTKSVSASGAKTTKEKLQPLVNQTVSVKLPSSSEVRPNKDIPATAGAPDVQSTSTKSFSASDAKTLKDKLPPSANQTVSVKSHSASEVKTSKDKPAPAGASDSQSTPTKSVSASGAKTTKEKLQPLVNQTVSVKSPSGSEVRPSRDSPATTGGPDVQPTSTKPPAASGTKTIKNKPYSSTNHTLSVNSLSGGEVRDSKHSASQVKARKDKPAPAKGPDGQSTSTKSASASGAKMTQNKPTASVNQTVVAKSPSANDVKDSKGKPGPNTVLSTPTKNVTASGPAADKDKLSASANHTTVIKTPTTTKEKSALSQPIKVVISNGCDSSNAKDQELQVQPGAPLVMTHKISLLPGGCNGDCEAEMVALKGRVARLEREMSLLKEKCPCSGNCPDDCSGNGKCEKGKCVCNQGFVGPDCKAVKDKTKETGETEQVNKNKENVHTFKKGTEVTKPKPSTTAKPTQQETATKITTTKGPTKTRTDVPIVKEGAASETLKTDHLKDEPRSNASQSNDKKSDGTTKIVTIPTKGLGTNKTRTGKQTLEQPIQADRNVTQSSGHKQSKTDKVDTNVQSVDNKNTDTGKIGKEKATQGNQYVVNSTITSTSHATQTLQNKTTVHGPEMKKRMRGLGLGSVKVVNISTYSFTLTWLAPKGMFKNFTVVRIEPKLEDDEDDHEEFEEEAVEKEKTSIAKNSTEARLQTESTNTVAKSAVSRGKADTKRVSIVVPGSVRSVEFSNLRPNTRYVLQIYGTGAEKKSKIHRVLAVTGPESATDIVFSNVTESSLTVSWSKPKTTFTGFRVTYTNIVTGESHFVTVYSRQSHVVLSKLSAGSSYIISVTTTQGKARSDALTSVITTVPAPPTHVQVVSVTDTRAVLQWTPSLGKVDRFIISYESSKTPNVTVTVMLSGNSVEHQLRGLQRGTLYTVKVLSQKDRHQSTAISTTFTTANVVKASEVGPRSAVIVWKTPTVVYHSYRVIYQVAGEEKKEVILDPHITEYKLTGLLPMTRYIVLVQGEREGQYTSVVTTEFITGKLRFPFPTECSQELLNGALQSGEVDIYPQGKEGQAVRVYCDMETDGGGWTVFQRRMNGKIDFHRTWSDYSAGFGNLSEEFWLGNELLHNLTSVGPVSLRVDMRSGNDTAFAHYANFSIGSEKRHYALTVSGLTGTAGDSMKYHNGRPFSTWDKEPDPLGIHCAKAYMGGWWYKNCYKTNLNGLYGTNSNNQGIVWIDWKGKNFSIPFTEMKFRPSRFSPATHG